MQLLMMYLFHCEVHPINLPIFPCPLLFCILFWPYFHAIANLRFLNYSVWKCAVMIITLLWSFYWAEAFGNHYIYSPFFLLSSHDHYIYGPFADLFIAHPWPLQIWSFFFFELRHLAYMVLFFILSELSHIGICNNGLLPPLPPMSAYDSIFFTLPCNMFRIAPNKICDTASVGSFIPYLPFCVCRQTFLLGDYKIPVHRCRFHFYSVSRLVVYTFLP